MEEVKSIMKMERCLLIRRSKAISVVLTTMIILVASIILAVGVVVYGTSLFQTSNVQEVISITGIKLWVNTTDSSGITWGAAAVRNSGDVPLALDKIEVRGTAVPFTNWYVDRNQTRVTIANFQSQFLHTGTDLTNAHELRDSVDSGGSVSEPCPASAGTDDQVIELDFDGNNGGGPDDKPTLCLAQTAGPTSLSPGERLIMYFHLPDGIISPVDSGTATNVGIFAGRAGAPVTTTVSNP